MDHDSRNPESRRQAVGLVGLGVAAAATPAVTHGTASDKQRASEPAMDDPRSKYPKPPFKSQTQPWPGLARDMDRNPITGKPAIAAPAGWPDARR